MLKNQKGFTLMELMIVIVIIGVLAAIGLPAYNSFVERSKKAVCDSNKRVIQTALDMYLVENPNPASTPTIGDLDTYMGSPDGDKLAQLKCPSDKTEGYRIEGTTVKCGKHDQVTP